ncbi:hypothetical protein KVR01_008125 [Diaporthe batatas]|uniref:uncharacterized protein n=1 Tax=Diaporthe batatas TaxID=748121 RepID=UPI001D03A070|nr:uncharacterized protein KVR01_008125 [Diaporthe batatas]KAG8162360.1 hypothetical protein KVR01_008125 [Diaporthe batatas]
MRLLSTNTLEVVLINEDGVPPYAILSHTWDKDEVTLQEMQGIRVKLLSFLSRNNLLKARQGLQKVLDAAKLAASDGYDWIWIDTCCIDKTSSTELSEAINSMYRWYQNSEICYVYLADATPESRGSIKTRYRKNIQHSRWITRGWTLQELIAPREVSFYLRDWSFMGKKGDEHIMRHLVKATGIDIGVLSGDIAMHEVSVANRMRWASRRETKRQEDMAYCLMGLFDVNMPLLYGEGGIRSFIRLQNEIIRVTDDQTIFAWCAMTGGIDPGRPSGLLADSPTYFEHVPSMNPISGRTQPESSIPWSTTNRGLMVQLYLRPSAQKHSSSAKEDSAEEFLAILDCSVDIDMWDGYGREHLQDCSPAILLRRVWGDQYARVRAYDALTFVGMDDRGGGEVKTIFVKQEQSRILPSFIIPKALLKGASESFTMSEVYPRALWDPKSGILRSRLSQQRGIQGIFRFSYPPGKGISGWLFDVAVALQPNLLVDGQFKAVGIIRPLEGRTVREAYDHINRTWVLAPRGGKADLVDEYRDRMIAHFHFREMQMLGGVSYVLDLVHRVELKNTVSQSFTNDAPSAYICAGTQLKSLFQPVCVSETLQPGRLISLAKKVRVRSRDRTFLEANASKRASDTSTEKSSPGAGGFDRMPEKSGCCNLIRQEVQCDRPDEDTLSSMLDQIATTVTDGDGMSAEQAKDPDGILKQVHFGISQDRLLHFAAFQSDSRAVSGLIDQCLQGDPVPITGTHIASILRNALDFREFLSNPTRDIEFTPNVMSSLRAPLGSVRGTGDTAIHLAATYSTREEFDRVIRTMFQISEGPEPWEDFDIKHEWSYLFRLQNGNGETVLHRAAAMANLEVVCYICEHAPDVACQIDSTNRSTLWHAACGGDDRIISVVATALKSLAWAPPVDYPDDNGLTPLHVACREGYVGCMRALLDLGASLRCATPFAALTPVHYASLFGHSGCLEVMSHHDQGREIKHLLWGTQKGELIQPIHLAAANGWADCVKILARHGSWFPLASFMCTVRESPSQSMSMSINGADLDAAEDGEVQVQKIPTSTPQEVAAKRGWDEVVEFLKAENAKWDVRRSEFGPWSKGGISLSTLESSDSESPVD